ncbi:MAG: fimbrial protein [Achromobacter sp.]
MGIAGQVFAACTVQGTSAPAAIVNFGNFPNPNQTSATGEEVGAPVILNFAIVCRRSSPAQLQTMLHFGSAAAPGRREGSFATGIDGLDLVVTLNVGPVQTSSQVRAQGNPVQTIGCTVSPSSNRVSVRLPTISTLALSGAGVTVGRTSFALQLQCGDARADVYIALTDANQPGNTTSVLTLDAASTARNIGVNILRADGVPVTFGPESHALGSANQWFAGSMTGAGLIDLSAQYVATGQPVVPGTVGASALFTLTYQ